MNNFMNKNILAIEVGSANTKSLGFKDGAFVEIPDIRLEIKNGYQKHGYVPEIDMDILCNHVNSFKKDYDEIIVVGTAGVRNMNNEGRIQFLDEFKKRTGIDFNVVTAEQEGELTVQGVFGSAFAGRLCVLIGGGSSTEIYIVDNKQIIDKYHLPFGAYSVSEKFPHITLDKSDVNVDEILEFLKPMIVDITSKADIMVLAGGDHLYVADKVFKDGISNNILYNDVNQPFMITAEDYEKCTRRYINQDDLSRYYNTFIKLSPPWWRGSRPMSTVVVAIARHMEAKILVPTRINMCIGLITKALNPL